jgi:carbon storage regulator CsrA
LLLARHFPEETGFLGNRSRLDLTCQSSADNKCVGTRQTNETTSPQQSESRKNQMLVLSRKVGETLVIDGNITVKVVRIQGNRVTLGIEAPSDVKILRGELNRTKATQTAEMVVEDGLLVAC